MLRFPTPPPEGEFVVVNFDLKIAERFPMIPHFAGLKKRQIADMYHPSSAEAVQEVIETMNNYEYDIDIEEYGGVSMAVEFDTSVKFFRRKG